MAAVSPRIHLNGSDPDSLRDQYMTALEKLQDALQAVRCIDVNQRDYYPPGQAAWTQAQSAHTSHKMYLESLISTYSDTIEHIDAHGAD